MPEQITIEDAYAELVQKYKRLPIQDGDITKEKFGELCGITPEAARNALEKEVKAGKLERLLRTSENKRPEYVYRILDTFSPSGESSQ